MSEASTGGPLLLFQINNRKVCDCSGVVVRSGTNNISKSSTK